MGLLFLRVAAGIALFAHAFARLRAELVISTIVPGALAIGVGILLLAGLWTPVAGALAAVLGFWSSVSLPQDPWAHILLGMIGAALALLGPGAWSVDARLFGWRRIDLDGGER